MSLLDCVCCRRHGLRTAICWDSADESSPIFLTYACLLERVEEIRTALRTNCNIISHSYDFATLPVPQLGKTGTLNGASRSFPPIAIYGKSCPEVVCALLGVMSVPVAYMPVDFGHPTISRWSNLRMCGVQTVLIEISLFSEFISEFNSQSLNCLIEFNKALLHVGFVICNIHWNDHVKSHDSHVNPLVRAQEDHVTEEFSATLKTYYEDVDIRCTLCCCECTTKGMLEMEKISSAVLRSSMDLKNTFPSIHPTSLAYWLYTTGTTGEPKLVQVPHCCIVPNVINLRRKFVISPDDVILNAAPLTFDPSVVEIFLALSSGACLLIVPTQVKQSPYSLSRVLFNRQYASVLQVTPSLIRQMSEENILSLLLGPETHVRVLAFGGEACPTFDMISCWKSPENKTSIFNIYGITEVSSWATCYQVTDEDLADVSLSTGSTLTLPVPLGSPLLGTQIELRDKNGVTMIDSGIGFIWIGGSYRTCILGYEHLLESGVMRPSGDLGHYDSHGRLCYDGRCDRQIKRLGHRINLDRIQQMIEGMEAVDSCALVTPDQPNLAGLNILVIAYLVLAEASLKIEENTKSLIFAKMKELLPNYCIPDSVEILEQMPINSHGKVDMKELRKLYCSSNTTLFSSSEVNMKSITVESIESLVKSSAMNLLGLEMWCSHQKLLELGASSFDVIRLANHLEDELKKVAFTSSVRNTTELVGQLLEKPLSQVAVYVCNSICGTSDNLHSDGPSDIARKSTQTNVQKRAPLVDNIPDQPPPKKQHAMELSREVSESGDSSKAITSWRRGQCFINGRLQDNLYQNFSSLPSDCSQPVCSFETKWKVNTGQCVDASPLLVLDKSRDPIETVYIGSHSGKFFAICLQTGRVLWEAQLTDRIESSACLSVCGQYVTVGCYDGHVFTLRCDSGDSYWCIKPGGSPEPVKSSPCTDPVTGLIWLGSHDHHIYALDIYAKEVLYRVYPGGGSCFSSPCIDCEKRMLYCATLQGNVAAVNLDSGDILWVYKCPKPVFSSPNLLTNRDSIVIGCVDGGVYIIGSNGQQVALLNTGGPVFSSSCVISCTSIQKSVGLTLESDFRTKIYCGSHDRHIYCWSENLKLEWKSQELDSEVYSIPIVTQISVKATSLGTNTISVLLVATTSGHIYLLKPDNGQCVGQCVLPWDVFSSPVLYGNQLIVGCRDDHVYCSQMIFTYSE